MSGEKLEAVTTDSRLRVLISVKGEGEYRRGLCCNGNRHDTPMLTGEDSEKRERAPCRSKVPAGAGAELERRHYTAQLERTWEKTVHCSEGRPHSANNAGLSPGPALLGR